MSAAESHQPEHVHAESEPVPPVGEEIHLPGGSVIPLTVAIGTTLLVIGTTIWIGWSVIGAIILVISISLWVRDVRRDVEALPEEHHH
jgi:hypothetical protein